MVDVSQVMIANTIICQIHVSRLTTPFRNELSCNCNCTEILTLLTMNLVGFPISLVKRFFVFPIFEFDC